MFYGTIMLAFLSQGGLIEVSGHRISSSSPSLLHMDMCRCFTPANDRKPQIESELHGGFSLKIWKLTFHMFHKNEKKILGVDNVKLY
jgi:hypothetical protein